MGTIGKIHRRKFLRDTAASAAAISLGTETLGAMSGSMGKSPANRVGLYSITFLGVWYKGNALTLDEGKASLKVPGMQGIMA